MNLPSKIQATSTYVNCSVRFIVVKYSRIKIPSILTTKIKIQMRNRNPLQGCSLQELLSTVGDAPASPRQNPSQKGNSGARQEKCFAGMASPTQRILSRSLMKLEAKDVSFFPVSPAMSLSEDRSCDAYKTMTGNETVDFMQLSHDVSAWYWFFLSTFPLTHSSIVA